MAVSQGPQPARYSRVMIGIHWLSAIIIIILLLQGLLMTKLEDDGLKTNIYRLHVTLGYLVLVLTIIRLTWARRDRRPEPLAMPDPERILYRGTHVLLYVGAFLATISGILLLAGSGIVPIAPEVIAADVDRSLPFRNAHWLFAMAMLILLIGHVGGVWIYQRRNGRTLERMGIGRGARN